MSPETRPKKSYLINPDFFLMNSTSGNDNMIFDIAHCIFSFCEIRKFCHLSPFFCLGMPGFHVRRIIASWSVTSTNWNEHFGSWCFHGSIWGNVVHVSTILIDSARFWGRQLKNLPKPLLRGLNLCESPVTPMIWNFLASAMIGYICMHVMISSSISISWQNAAGWIKGSRIHSIISAMNAERFGLSCSIQFRAALYRFQFWSISSAFLHALQAMFVDGWR